MLNSIDMISSLLKVTTELFKKGQKEEVMGIGVKIQKISHLP